MNEGHKKRDFILANKKINENDIPSLGAIKAAGRRERRCEETRERIFRTALQLFAERGFSAATIESITEAADVGKGTFFNYFENKESLLLEFRERQMGKVSTFVSNSINSDASLSTVIYEFAVSITEHQRNSPALFQSLIIAVLSNETVQKKITEGLNRARQMLAELVVQRQQCGEIRADLEPVAIVQALQQMIFGTMLIWSLSPNTPFEEELKKMTDVFVFGIRSMQKTFIPSEVR